MSASRKTLSGIVGVDRKTIHKALWTLIASFLVLFSSVAPGTAFAEPEVPSPTPIIPTVEVPAPPAVQQAPPPQQAPASVPVPAPQPPVPPVVEVPAPAPPVVETPTPAPPASVTITQPTVERPAPVPVTPQAPAPKPAPAPSADPQTTVSAVPTTATATATPSATPTVAPTTVTEPATTTSPSGSSAPSRTELPQQSAGGDNGSGSGQQAPGNQETPRQQNGTDQNGTSPADSGTPSTASSTSKEPASQATPVVEEAPVAAPVDVVPQEGAKVIPKEALKQESPVEGQVASEDTVAMADDAILAAAYRASDRDNRDRDNDHGNGNNGNGSGNGHNNGGHNSGGPRDPDPQGWHCDDRRGAYGCPWNDWDHDDHGRPVFHNQFSFDLRVVYFDGFNRVEVIVRAGTNQPINTPGSGAYAFVVVGVSNPDFAVNVGVGVFNSGGYGNGNCGINPRYCERPSVTQVGVYVNVSNRQVYYPNVGAYDCGCGVTYQNQYYDRIYVGGTREVIGHWIPATQSQPRYFQSWGYKDTPASPVYVQGTPPEFSGYGGLGANPDDSDQSANASAASDLTDNSVAYAVAAFVLVIVLGAGGFMLVRRLRRA